MNSIIIENYEIPIESHKGKIIVIGSDHRGYAHKKELIKFLKEKNYGIIDVGTDSEERCDYPEISDKIGRNVSNNYLNSVGIGICGSGIGIIIPASKYGRIIASRCLTAEDAISSRKHNNSNVIGLSADLITIEESINIIESWLETKFYSDKEKDDAYLKRYLQTIKLEEQHKY